MRIYSKKVTKHKYGADITVDVAEQNCAMYKM